VEGTLTVPAHLNRERADRIVAALAGVSRAKAKELCELGVLVDGHPVRAQDRISAGSRIEIPSPPPEEIDRPRPGGVTLRYEDADLLVVDKPAGLVVHRGAGHRGPTLAATLLERFPELGGVGDPGRGGLVHRLDRDTSGLLVVARNQAAYQRLTAALAARRIRRQYLALVHGRVDPPTGTVEAPIESDPRYPRRKRVGPRGRPARTHYRVRELLGPASLLEVELETGRTHQIRVHMEAIGHPLVGDRLYSRRRDPVPVPRMFLHAAGLTLSHPSDGHQLTVASPLPDDLEGVLVELRRKAGTVGP
jgi:23S rRNA pseudouridine1911/1915/1917 synthase